MYIDDIKEMQHLFENLYNIITIDKKNNNFTLSVHNRQYALPILRNIIEYLNNIFLTECKDYRNDIIYIREQNNLMYPPKSGLSEFYVWSDDYEIRKQINNSFIETKETIASKIDELIKK